MSDLSRQLISSIPITHMSRPQWIQFKDAIERLHELEAENGRLKDALTAGELGELACVLMAYRTTAKPALDLSRALSDIASIVAARAILAQTEPKP